MPNDAAAKPAQYEFGPFRLDAASRALYRGAEFVPLTPKAAEILLLLIEESGHVVTKEQLLARVWPDVIVEEGTIANNISALRKAVESSEFGTDGPIATVPRRGYRFTAEVRAMRHDFDLNVRGVGKIRKRDVVSQSLADTIGR